MEWHRADRGAHYKQPPPKTQKEALGRLKGRKLAVPIAVKDVIELPRNAKEAVKLGWREGELGWECPTCVTKADAQADLDAQEGAGDDSIQQFLIKNGLAVETPKRSELWATCTSTTCRRTRRSSPSRRVRPGEGPRHLGAREVLVARDEGLRG
jgi:hypothetical protein